LTGGEIVKQTNYTGMQYSSENDKRGRYSGVTILQKIDIIVMIVSQYGAVNVNLDGLQARIHSKHCLNEITHINIETQNSHW
jgi:hypothetical protein